MTRWCAAGVAWALVGSSFVAPASAEERPLKGRLEWIAPAECPDRAAIENAVNEAMSRRALSEETPDLIVRGRIEEGQGGEEGQEDEEGAPYSARLLLSTADGVEIGERTVVLESPRCADALAPLTLVLALMLDVSRREIELRVAAPPAPAEADGPPEAPAEVHAIFGLGGGFVYQLVPGTVALVGARAGAQIGVWTIEGWFELTSEGDASLGDASVHASAGLGGVLGCGFPVALPQFSFGLCGEVGAGWTAAHGEGLAETRSSLRPQAIVGLAMRLRLALSGPVGMRLDAGARAVLVRDQLRLAPEGEPEVVFEPWPIVPYAMISVDLRL